MLKNDVSICLLAQQRLNSDPFCRRESSSPTSFVESQEDGLEFQVIQAKDELLYVLASWKGHEDSDPHKDMMASFTAAMQSTHNFTSQALATTNLVDCEMMCKLYYSQDILSLKSKDVQDIAHAAWHFLPVLVLPVNQVSIRTPVCEGNACAFVLELLSCRSLKC